MLFINMLCLSDITVFPDELDWSDTPDTNVCSLSASEACFRLASWGVGGLDTENMKSSLSSPLMEQESPLLIEKAAESGVLTSKWSGLEGENIIKLINTINSAWNFGNSNAQWNSKINSGYTDPTQATTRLLIVLVSRIQGSGNGDKNLVKCKGWEILVRLT